MISGRSSGSGRYSFHERHSGQHSVMVTQMPEDTFHIRVVFRHMGEPSIPILKMNETEAMLLWSALKETAIDFKWDDRMVADIVNDMKKEGESKK